VLGEFSDAQAVAELLEDRLEARISAVEVFAFRDEPEVVIAADALAAEELLKGFQVARVDDQEFVLVELDFHRLLGTQHGDSGAAIIEEQILEVAQVALQDRQVNGFAVKVAMMSAIALMAGFQDDIDDFAERIEHLQEKVEEAFARDGSGQDRHAEARPGVAIGVDAKTLTGDHLPVDRGPDCLGQPEVAVTVHLKMGSQFISTQGNTLRSVDG
jgi:hypothetical protein